MLKWKCGFCGSENERSETCSHCGAHHENSEITQPMRSLDLEGVFFVDPDNRSFVERKTRRLSDPVSKMGCFTLIPIVMGVAGLLIMIWLVREWIIFAALNRLGVVTSGEITERYVSKDSDDGDVYYISFRYQDNGIEYTQRQSVSSSVYRSVEVGAGADVQYVANNPSVAVLAGTNDAPIAISGFALCWNAFVWAFLIGLLNTRRHNNLLAREGQIIKGEVVAASGKQDTDNDLILKVEYAFRTPEAHNLVVGTRSETRNDLNKHPLPSPGTPVLVLYRSANHHMAL